MAVVVRERILERCDAEAGFPGIAQHELGRDLVPAGLRLARAITA